MPSTSETGHAKNVANFETMISFCTGYGAQYDPSKANIKLAALGTKLTASQGALTTVNTLLPPWQNGVNGRELIFDPFSKLVTKILNAVEASDVTPAYIKDVKTLTRKLTGKRATPKIKDDPATPEDESLKSISASQMSFDNRIENFDKLIDLLSSNAAYAPNENAVKVATLTTLKGTMSTSNTTVKDAYTPLSNARISRDVILYDATNGLVKCAGDVKKYIKSVFGGTSAQYKQVSKLIFKKPKKA